VQKRQPFPKKIDKSKPMDFRWVDYEYCQYKVQQLGFKSARHYIKWVKEFKPAGFPKRPELVYRAEWVSWNEFLGGDNVYLANHPQAVKKADIIPYWDAVNLIQGYSFETVEKYLEAFDAGQIPKGIPRRPHLRYKEFYQHGGYKTFLGKDIKHRIEASKNINPLLVLYQGNSQSSNVISILVHKKSVHELRELIKERELKIVKVYHWYDDFAEGVFDILNHFGTKQNDTTWMFSNVNEVLFELGSVLEIYRII